MLGTIKANWAVHLVSMHIGRGFKWQNTTNGDAFGIPDIGAPWASELQENLVFLAYESTHTMPLYSITISMLKSISDVNKRSSYMPITANDEYN